MGSLENENAQNNAGNSVPAAPLASLFLGPHAENADQWMKAFNKIFLDHVYWRKNYYPKDGYMLSDQDMEKGKEFYRRFTIQMEDMLNVLKGNFPFFSPRYMAHMLSEQTLPAVMGYFATMLYNPNNCTEEAAPVTVAKELEFGKRICKMLGYNEEKGWAHLCSGGSAANLEALWVARQSQFQPLILRDVCRANGWDFRIKRPKSSAREDMVLLTDCTDRELLHLKPNEALYMTANLARYLKQEHGMSLVDIMNQVEKDSADSEYNIRNRGYGNVLAKTGLKPVVFVSQSAHYSLKKTMNILGYGEHAIRPIPTTEKFRINVSALEKMIRDVKEDEYIAAVVAVFGTTEEGAVDPIHEVKWLRDSIAAELNISFWLHVDAAWGGYFAVMKHDEQEGKTKKGKPAERWILDYNKENFLKSVEAYMNALAVEEDYVIRYSEKIKRKGGTDDVINHEVPDHAEWKDINVFAAMFALSAADSITVDPHKMGYVPYPAGVVAFANKRMVFLLQQQAAYIGTDSKYIVGDQEESSFTANYYKLEDDFDIKGVGAYTLEGSRPGAAAMSCWFASEVVPLDIQHHGKIVRTSVLNARKFAHYLQQHHKGSFVAVDKKLKETAGLKSCKVPFIIELLYDNVDTNLVCYFVRPAKWEKDNSEIPGQNQHPRIVKDSNWSLEEINRINERIAEAMTITPSNLADSRKTSLYQKFYVAKTTVSTGMYSADSMVDTLNKFGFSKEEYEKHGLVVMRSTIMNPWYFQASHTSAHTDFFMELLEELHLAARNAIDEEVLRKYRALISDE